jgi:uncharacterized protein DUF6206
MKNIDINLLGQFEDHLNPAYPEQSGIPPNILGYGEISTTFSISDMPDIAFKRMPPFGNSDQISSYKASVDQYCSLLSDKCGIQVSDYAFYEVINPRDEHILYVAQPRLPASSIGNIILKSGTRHEMEHMIRSIMTCIAMLLKFNLGNDENRSLGLDGQISNWSFRLADKKKEPPVYFDITTPMFRVNEKEQLDTEIFLKSCPSFLVWLVRWQFLQEVLDRYYDVRMILIDVIANFHKEGRQDMIDDALSLINEMLEKENLKTAVNAIKRSEVDNYYKNDAFIWALFLRLRRFDRFIKTKLFRKHYNFILPGKISR